MHSTASKFYNGLAIVGWWAWLPNMLQVKTCKFDATTCFQDLHSVHSKCNNITLHQGVSLVGVTVLEMEDLHMLPDNIILDG